MPTSVLNETAHREYMIDNASKVIGKSNDRLKVFEAIYFNKTAVKTQEFIQKRTGLKTLKRVLEEGKKLATEKIVEQVKDDNGKTAYKKIDFYYKNKNNIISKVKKIISNKNLGIKYVTRTPRLSLQIKVNEKKSKAEEITIDNIDSFSKATKINKVKMKRYYESEIKELLKKIVGEQGKFVDWGGEQNDINTTRLIMNGKRISAAFALKGKGTSAPLNQKKMGKNGDQISRLFKSPARVFIVQFDQQIDESIRDLMKDIAENKAHRENRKIYYGTIDGTDTSKLFQAYSRKSKK
jgi:hypothetical protein